MALVGLSAEPRKGPAHTQPTFPQIIFFVGNKTTTILGLFFLRQRLRQQQPTRTPPDSPSSRTSQWPLPRSLRRTLRASAPSWLSSSSPARLLSATYVLSIPRHGHESRRHESAMLTVSRRKPPSRASAVARPSWSSSPRTPPL